MVASSCICDRLNKDWVFGKVYCTCTSTWVLCTVQQEEGLKGEYKVITFVSGAEWINESILCQVSTVVLVRINLQYRMYLYTLTQSIEIFSTQEYLYTHYLLYLCTLIKLIVEFSTTITCTSTMNYFFTFVICTYFTYSSNSYINTIKYSYSAE